MFHQVTGTWGAPIVARLDPQADVLQAIRAVAKANDITSGVVFSIVGALDRAVLQTFEEGASKSRAVEIEGPVEAHGGGIIGVVDAPLRGGVPFGRGGPTRGDLPEGYGGYVHGESYVHLHMTVTVGDRTVSGHVMPGCIVRSHHPISHITVVIAPIVGVMLKHTTDGTPDAGQVGVYHVLDAV
ncbi:PPC domain-containing DNA-binding protein [Dactylosporangium sp. AC04546]|uniref:PPC domain-containing DNA-binding protein n=1 Tax=Dactylosporangium sp. AC04546 TaxID=2862460 RepID=UPI001EE10086|nr:PPC domain-containing DNA-binding protein [Dactylosporangium sp. AC04546]WVK79537.1 PPC domain-containing DNA-binding protein [Dactylosporangium sp. AC04546]